MKVKTYLLLALAAHCYAFCNTSMAIDSHKQQEPKAAAKPIYAMLTSSGTNSEDFDVLISARLANIFSFKRCAAYTKSGSRTEIADFRTLRYTNPEKINDFQASQELMAEYFNGQNCKLIGKNASYLFENKKFERYESHGNLEYFNSSIATPIAFMGLLSAWAGGVALNDFIKIDQKYIKPHNENIYNLFKTAALTSRSYSKSFQIKLSGVYFTISAATAIYYYEATRGDQSKENYENSKQHQQNQEVCEVNLATYRSLSSLDNLKPGNLIFDVETTQGCGMKSFSNFMDRFEAGLKLATEQKVLLPL